MAYYRAQAENQDELKTGVEWERFGAYTPNQKLVPYTGRKGYAKIMQFLYEKKGWTIEKKQKNRIFGLQRGLSRVALEGDGRPEISAAPFPSLHIVAKEIAQMKSEIDHISDTLGISWVALGLHPFVKPEDIQVIPEKRYQFIIELLQKYESWTETYMRILSGTHLNFGYTNEENLIRKAQVLHRLTPLLSALFATSPFENGKQTGALCTRRKKIFTKAPPQIELPGNLLQKDFSLEKWIAWYAQRNVFIFPQKLVVPPKNFSFLNWMEKGFEGVFPTIADFDQHVKMCWNDLRLRPSYIEFRAFDTVPYPLLMAATAFTKGLIFDQRGWEAVEKVTKGWTEKTIATLDKQSWKEGLAASVDNFSLLEMGRELLPVAMENLAGFDRLNEENADERIFLEPVERLLEKGISAAQDLLEFSRGDPEKIVAWSEKEF